MTVDLSAQMRAVLCESFAFVAASPGRLVLIGKRVVSMSFRRVLRTSHDGFSCVTRAGATAVGARA